MMTKKQKEIVMLLLRALIITIIIHVLIILASGCATVPIPRAEYTLRDTIVILQSVEDTNKSYRIYGGSQPCAGFQVGNRVYCNWDGEEPDFETLGHEIWHIIAGKFHN